MAPDEEDGWGRSLGCSTSSCVWLIWLLSSDEAAITALGCKERHSGQAFYCSPSRSHTLCVYLGVYVITVRYCVHHMMRVAWTQVTKSKLRVSRFSTAESWRSVRIGINGSSLSLCWFSVTDKHIFIFTTAPTYPLPLWFMCDLTVHSGLLRCSKSAVSQGTHVLFCEKQRTQCAWKGLYQIPSCQAEYL